MEFHAIIFCGKGNLLSPFSSVRASGVPKALLPIANKAMIEYVLEWCDQAPFKEVTVVCDNDDFVAIKPVVDAYINLKRDKDILKFSKMNCIGFDGELLTTTGEIVNSLRDRIISDFVILPCDFITDLPPQVLIEAYRNRSADDLGLGIFYHNSFENIDKKLLKSNYTIYSSQDDGHDNFLDLYSKESIDLQKALQVRTQMIWRYPKSIVSTKLLDSFIFFCSFKILSIVHEEFSKNKANKSCTKIMRDLARRSWKHSTERETIGFFLLPKQCAFVRCNNLSSYLEANRYYLKLQLKSLIQPSIVPKEKGAATIGADSKIGENTNISERTSVKRSVVGNNCNIGKRCRLTGCIIMDNVIVEDEVLLENCIVGAKVVISTKSKLTNCNIEANYTVLKGTQAKGETIIQTSLEGLEDEDDDYGSLYGELSDENEETGPNELGVSEEDEDEYDDYDEEEFEDEFGDTDFFSR
ncbi:hypothetical protein PACTADRAFT_47655 [Pachysolen tannophilus NRRL Y-2460]|uniref:Translation initiation factor eIF2B subunit gamma n=1 Tax=Pachysolen tannophilus NRRL Y-2460 TaxID=669874 RepID=A0A1E4U1D7_PACTA|nr:hypothetical protein PACTADRAFT_47655 [Pachysolen tannophilus NRRL Y-2460]